MLDGFDFLSEAFESPAFIWWVVGAVGLTSLIILACWWFS